MRDIKNIGEFKFGAVYSITDELPIRKPVLFAECGEWTFSFYDTLPFENFFTIGAPRPERTLGVRRNTEDTTMLYFLPESSWDNSDHSIRIRFQDDLLRVWFDDGEIGVEKTLGPESFLEPLEDVEALEIHSMSSMAYEPYDASHEFEEREGCAGDALYCDEDGTVEWRQPELQPVEIDLNTWAIALAKAMAVPKDYMNVGRALVDVEPLPIGAYARHHNDPQTAEDFRLVSIDLVDEPEEPCRIRRDDPAVCAPYLPLFISTELDDEKSVSDLMMEDMGD